MVNIVFAFLMSFIRCVVFMYLGIITILRLIKRKSEKIKKGKFLQNILTHICVYGILCTQTHKGE